MGLPDPIRIDGLKQFRGALRAMDPALAKELKQVGNTAAELVVAEARPRVPTLTGRAAKSVRVASTGSAARVAAGGKRVPYFPWLDFGGKVGRNDTAARPFLPEGRYIWSAFDDRRDDVERVLVEGMEALAQRAGLGPT